VEAELTLLIDEHVDQVWLALTSSDWLPQWLAPGHIETRLGGRVKLDFEASGQTIDSAVTAFRPGGLIEYSWSALGQPEQRLRWALEPIGPTTYVTLSLSLPDEPDAARACAGWAAHLDMLVAALAHIPVKFPVDVFNEARRSFGERLACVATEMAA
jgi:uncharacterized protein YndB with AHSA1/START domain